MVFGWPLGSGKVWTFINGRTGSPGSVGVWLWRCCRFTLAARIVAGPIYELKTCFASLAYLCSEHVMAVRTRVSEMRGPPLGLDEVPHPALEVFFDEILAAPPTGDLLVSIYENAVPALDAA